MFLVSNICCQAAKTELSKYGISCKKEKTDNVLMRIRLSRVGSDGKYVASCAVHSMPVEAFIEPAEQKDTRVRGCIVSIAKDNSIALISVDSMTW